MNTHIDTLGEWYADAEQITKANLPRAGDTLILPYNAGGYGVEVEEDGWTPDDVVRGEPTRILARAPKPRPAWHDAPAVTAKGREDWDHVEAFSRNDDYDPPRWIDNQGITYTAEQLSDVTPLIEAKVTDEMIVRAANAWTGNGYQTTRDLSRDLREDITHALTAALGLETT